MEIINYLFCFVFFFIQFLIIFNKKIEIWDGLCGENGKPEVNELIKISAFLTINFSWSQTLFFDKEPNFEILGTALVTIGITSLPQFRKNTNSNQNG